MPAHPEWERGNNWEGGERRLRHGCSPVVAAILTARLLRISKPLSYPKPYEDYLRFDVSDLCREVIKDAQNPTICRWLKRLGYNCNWTARELPSFTFVYLPANDGLAFLVGSRTL